ncbi:MAG: hypothetical protein HY722_13845 [Planctomycetes bacterium]|nr:hypothetical protein [Planctomycetota bacterium]
MAWRTDRDGAGACPDVLILGGSGVFGGLLAREVLAAGVATVTLACRDRRRAADVCAALDAPGRARPLGLGPLAPGPLREAALGHAAVLCAAGPFQDLDPGLPAAAVAAGAHWLDLADDPGWIAGRLADGPLHGEATRRALRVCPGVSTVPALAWVLLEWARRELGGARRARWTLLIGNRNAKGQAAVESLLASGLSRPRTARLPWGRFASFRFGEGVAALEPIAPGVVMEFRLALEHPEALRLLAAASRLARGLGPAGRRGLAAALVALARPLSGLGTDAGCLVAEVEGGRPARRLRLVAHGAGQRMAILPCVVALRALLAGTQPPGPWGCVAPWGLMAWEEWRTALAASGLRLEEVAG